MKQGRNEGGRRSKEGKMEDGRRERWKMDGGKDGRWKEERLEWGSVKTWYSDHSLIGFVFSALLQIKKHFAFSSCRAPPNAMGGRRCALPPNPPPAFFKLLMFHTHLCMQTLYAKTLSLSISFRPSIALSIYYISRFLIYPNIPVSLHHSSLSCLFDSQSFMQCSCFCPPNAMGGRRCALPPNPPPAFCT